MPPARLERHRRRRHGSGKSFATADPSDCWIAKGGRVVVATRGRDYHRFAEIFGGSLYDISLDDPNLALGPSLPRPNLAKVGAERALEHLTSILAIMVQDGPPASTGSAAVSLKPRKPSMPSSALLTILREALACENVECTGAADIYTKRLEDFKTMAPGAKTYLDYAACWKTKSIDAVLIATPQHLHSGALRGSLDAGKHVYQERPWPSPWSTPGKCARPGSGPASAPSRSGTSGFPAGRSPTQPVS